MLESADLALDGLELKETSVAATASDVNGNGEVDSEEMFDYDSNGVVDVNLDETEPVPLPKDKQIV